ncbi:MAG: 4Fe-4S binding protein [Tannerella sp.]|jgi:ferredoxin|nr:4Fe-4S binding protein [Tannerella sp.]
MGQIQLLPAILNGIWIWVIILFIITLLFGRIYCSVLCPAGVLQDIINRLFCIGKKKKKGSHRFRYHKAHNWLRYILLVLTGGLALFGFMELCTLLDPYSNFGRIAANLFRPVTFWFNNILAGILNKSGNYTLIHTSIQTVTIISTITAGVALVVFIAMVIMRGRLFCNTLCPVGALLSLVSRYSFFRIAISGDRCSRCKACVQTCKAEAICTDNMSIDMSRCVGCFNCISSCRKGAIQYIDRRKRILPVTSEPPTHSMVMNVWHPVGMRHISTATDTGRRSFIATSAAIATTLPVAILNAKQQHDHTRPNNGRGIHRRFGRQQLQHGSHDENYQGPVTPPGSLSLTHFKEKCTACHLCVTRCPSNVLRPAGFEYGFGYLLKPYMSFMNSFCNYACTVCTEVCPTGAIQRVTEEEKKTIQVGIARLHLNLCIVHSEETSCGACSEHCTTQAVHMVPYKGTLTIPQIEPDLCIGCGGCESICPVITPHRAIIVVPNQVHLIAQLPPEEEKIEVKIDGFGF